LEQEERSEAQRSLFAQLQERMEQLKESGKDLRLPEVPMVTAFRYPNSLMRFSLPWIRNF
jgi:hypothetical protein